MSLLSSSGNSSLIIAQAYCHRYKDPSETLLHGLIVANTEHKKIDRCKLMAKLTDLPNEVKDRIVEYIFAGKTMIHSRKNSKISRRVAKKLLSVSTLLLVSKSLFNCHQIINVLLKEAWIKFQSQQTLGDIVASLSPNQRAFLRNIEMMIPFTCPLWRDDLFSTFPNITSFKCHGGLFATSIKPHARMARYFPLKSTINYDDGELASWPTRKRYLFPARIEMYETLRRTLQADIDAKVVDLTETIQANLFDPDPFFNLPSDRTELRESVLSVATRKIDLHFRLRLERYFSIGAMNVMAIFRTDDMVLRIQLGAGEVCIPQVFTSNRVPDHWPRKSTAPSDRRPFVSDQER